MAKRIQHRWERISTSSVTDYLDGRAQIWTTIPALPASYMDIRDDGYFYNYASKFQYKVEGDKIMYVLAGVDRFTTPQYKDTLLIKEVNDNLLVLYRQFHYISGAYQHVEKRLDSLKR